MSETPAICEMCRWYQKRCDWYQSELEKLQNKLCDCVTSENSNKPKQHGADPHAKNCAVYGGK